jgi:hypothetical protein
MPSLVEHMDHLELLWILAAGFAAAIATYSASDAVRDRTIARARYRADHAIRKLAERYVLVGLIHVTELLLILAAALLSTQVPAPDDMSRTAVRASLISVALLQAWRCSLDVKMRRDLLVRRETPR